MSDLISRQDAIRWVKTECNPYGKPTLDFESGKKVIEHLEQMPSTDRPQGEWIYCEEDDSHLPEDGRYGIFKCSNCGSKQSFPISEGSGRVYGDNYCPSCGARMKGADDEYDK